MNNCDLLDMITGNCREADRLFPADRNSSSRRAEMALAMIHGSLRFLAEHGEPGAKAACDAAGAVLLMETKEDTSEVPKCE